MIHSQNERVVVFNGPATEATNATNAAVIDCLGENRVRIEVALPPATATNSSATWTSLVLGHSTDATNATAISTGGTDFTIGTHNDTANAGLTAFEVNLVNRERYLHVTAQCPAAHSTVTYTARFGRKPEALGTDADQGADEVVYV